MRFHHLNNATELSLSWRNNGLFSGHRSERAEERPEFLALHSVMQDNRH